jgi:GNAT superfamily N-acetyltransferase
MDESIQIINLTDRTILQIVDMDCSPLPNERDSVFLSFYRFFRDTCWVALKDDELIGFALGFVDQTNNRHGYLNYLFVKEEYRKTGIGSRLLKQFEFGIKSQGCNIASLLTSKQETIDYYYKHGYAINHKLPGWSEDDDVYSYYYNTKRVSLLIKNL